MFPVSETGYKKLFKDTSFGPEGFHFKKATDGGGNIEIADARREGQTLGNSCGSLVPSRAEISDEFQ